MQTFREYSENAKSIIATINNRLKDIAIHDDKYTGLLIGQYLEEIRFSNGISLIAKNKDKISFFVKQRISISFILSHGIWRAQISWVGDLDDDVFDDAIVCVNNIIDAFKN